MNKPFRDVNDFWRPELELVPDHLYYQTMAYFVAPEQWCNEEAVRSLLESEAFRGFHRNNVWAMLQANRELIEEYLDGNLDKDRIPEAAPAGDKPPLAQDQINIVQHVLESVGKGMELRRVQEDRWKGEDGDDAEGGNAEPEDFFAQQASPNADRRAFAVLGPAGSGKTSCIQKAIDEVAAKGGKILITAPTGKLSATFRQKYPRQDVDTMHGAFALWKPLRQTLEIMIPYDLVIVEEVGQVSRDHFERIMELWKYAERLPTLVFVGDFWQLPGVDPSKAFDSPMWKGYMVKSVDQTG